MILEFTEWIRRLNKNASVFILTVGDDVVDEEGSGGFVGPIKATIKNEN